MVKRKSIKLPEDIIAEIDGCVDKSKGQFRSRPEVVMAALEKFLKGTKKGSKKNRPIMKAGSGLEMARGQPVIFFHLKQ